MSKEKNLLSTLYFPILIIVIIWLIKLVEISLSTSFIKYGTYPLSILGMRGIIFGPFIHSDFKHLISNTFPLFFLSAGLFYFYRILAFKVFFFIWLISGIWLWLGAREAYHVGASGWVYGLAAFLFLSGILTKNRKMAAVSLVIVFVYGGIFWGIFPVDSNVSWEGHLWGFISGLVAAIYFRKSYLVKSYESDDYDNTDFSYTSQTLNDFDIKYEYVDNDELK